MLPMRASNSFTDRSAREEILDRVAIAVCFGAAACDPLQDTDALLRKILEADYDGVANAPTAIH